MNIIYSQVNIDLKYVYIYS
ncbi:hypothetical protein SAMN02743940_0672 [Nitrosomonas cryotolerans ATCC 49181]|uniref:Uncharacterized protein n=1 Tax=Nitrosomonas cryotolerans ATCC 49181 TaxID=1131553 RepID=A0A1N6GEV9_9PROT|nr:hypothetical protein SAMN02743940_0672 [Nitrosomonas cryotolerans ATCC 49181]